MDGLKEENLILKMFNAFSNMHTQMIQEAIEGMKRQKQGEAIATEKRCLTLAGGSFTLCNHQCLA